MGKKGRLNKLISKWIKSDLPEDCSSVLLLNVTSLQSSPKPTRRPFSLPLSFGLVSSSCSKSTQVRRNSSNVSNGHRPCIAKRDTCRRGFFSKFEKRAVRIKQDKSKPSTTIFHTNNLPANGDVCENIENNRKLTSDNISNTPIKNNKNFKVNNTEVVAPGRDVNNISLNHETNNNNGTIIIKEKSLNAGVISTPVVSSSSCISYFSSSSLLPDNNNNNNNDDDDENVIVVNMDSNGTCSLNMDASTEVQSDWPKTSDSARIVITSATNDQHLPSYLSLACTVNGYSTTTNYDPIRLARSRDASPNRIDSTSYLIGNHTTNYSVTNNLLSPPNLVPLPTPKIKEMSENVLQNHHHQQLLFKSTKTMSFTSTSSTNEKSHFSTTIFSKDTTDGCLNHTQHAIQKKNITYEKKNISNACDQSRTIESSVLSKEFTNGKETKSFIQQRVERLYGPGALAHGFFISKTKKSRDLEGESVKKERIDKLNSTLPDKFEADENIEPSMKPSSSFPSLPVLRHLRPEFRAQLPIIRSRKVDENSMQKSITVPKLTNDVKVTVNGHGKSDEKYINEKHVNGKGISTGEESIVEKDGHYFLNVLEKQTSKLLQLADNVEKELNNADLSEEIMGKLRSASGKARLLVSQKMQQFKGLCTNNITQGETEAFPTTNEDLQGFWDMVMLQVNQVDVLFDEINKLRTNNWEEIKPEKNIATKDSKIGDKAKSLKITTKAKPCTANEEARKKREEQRKKMIEERRKAMKTAQQCKTPSIEIFVPESS